MEKYSNWHKYELNTKKMRKRVFPLMLSLTIIMSSIVPVIAEEDENNIDIPEPIKVVDFSNSFEALATEDEKFEVVDNDAKPTLVADEEMGQVLQLGKAVIEGQKLGRYGELIEDKSIYSTIKLTNPYVGRDYLKEYEPYEDVKTINNRNYIQPKWEEGITISYWIKSPNAVNSNVLGFTSERFQIQADDYAKYLCTVKFNIEYNSMTDEEREALDIGPSGVLPGSDFYFEYADGESVDGKPIYVDEEKMGRTYWMNKFYEPGYLLNEDGTITESAADAYYEKYVEAPRLGSAETDHDPGNSNLRYGWTYSEMWLDASSSFYFENDSETDIQLNPNHINSYNTVMGMQHDNCFCINSWKYWPTFELAIEELSAAPSPLSEPDKWHNVTVVIQNDWVLYYLDGKEINIEENYSSYGGADLPMSSKKPWKRFNKGAGSRYGYGNNKRVTYWCYYGNYVATTMMEWLIMDCTKMTIGGGNKNGDGYNMFANTDEILIKNIVFYDKMLTAEQIQVVAEDPFMYEYSIPDPIPEKYGDVNGDGNINATDALLVLQYAAKITELDEKQLLLADINENGKADALDALYILRTAAKQ